MAYTNPKTWAVKEELTSSDLNTYVRDNLAALKDPPSDSYVLNEASDYTTTSTSFVDVDATNLALTITTTGGDVMVHFYGNFDGVAPNAVFVDVDLDGTRIGGDDGLIKYENPSYVVPVSFTRLITGLAAGSHTLKLQWKVSAGTTTLYAGAGTSTYDLHPQFWAREVS